MLYFELKTGKKHMRLVVDGIISSECLDSYHIRKSLAAISAATHQSR